MPPVKPINRIRREPPTLTSLAITGYKSVSRRCEIEIRPLTILAGANSSGKSSIIQPLLLLKQTLEETYDPGALLLNGPIVRFTSANEILSRNAEGEEGTKFTVELRSQSRSILSRYVKRKKLPFDIETTQQIFPDHSIALTPASTSKELAKQILDYNSNAPTELVSEPSLFEEKPASPVTVRRNRCFLEATVTKQNFFQGPGGKKLSYSNEVAFTPGSQFSQILRGIIYLPGLRGTPERTYPVTAVGTNFPGSFEKYVASVIVAWQVGKQTTRLHAISGDLQALGLTWKVSAHSLNEAQVAIQVGRLPKATVGGAHDLVSIADVGVGVSQTLPIIVALQAARAGQIVYIEQPEIHLHPRAQSALAAILGRAAKRGVRVIIETHSDLLLLAIQESVARGELATDSVALHWFEREEGVTKVSTGHINEAGAFGNWPADFTTVRMQAEDRFLTAAENRLRN